LRHQEPVECSAFDGADELAFPLHQVDLERVVSWLDDNLVDFVDTYASRLTIATRTRTG
jgi:hypothetical protein